MYLAAPPAVSKVRVAFGSARPVSSGFLPSPKSAALSALYARTRLSSFDLSNLSMS
jgi:hypothetical protein